MNATLINSKLDNTSVVNKSKALLETNSIIALPTYLYSVEDVKKIVKDLDNLIDLVIFYPSKKELSTSDLSLIDTFENDKHVYLLNTIKFIK